VDAALIKKLEVRRFGDGKKKQPRGKAIPAGKSYTEKSDEDSDTGSEVESEVECEVESSEEEELPDLDQAPIPGPSKQKSSPSPAFQPGSHVVAEYEGEYFLCEVTQNQEDVAKGYTRLSYTTIKGKNSFAWGEKPDLMITLNEDILVKDVIPQPINSRGHFGLESKDLMAVLKKWLRSISLPC
jgi:hypothetical protein